MSFYGSMIFDNAEKGTIDLVLDVCCFLKYKSIFHKIHLKDTAKSFLSLSQF